MIVVDVQRETAEESPDDESFKAAATLALRMAGREQPKPTEISLRIVDEAEMQALNQHYRNKAYPTNVLSFPAQLDPAIQNELSSELLGDIAVCAPVVIREAQAQGKHSQAHWDHMMIHGVLHLLGFDHENDTEAQQMERIEIEALGALGWPNPYSESRAESTVDHPVVDSLDPIAEDRASVGGSA